LLVISIRYPSRCHDKGLKLYVSVQGVYNLPMYNPVHLHLVQQDYLRRGWTPISMTYDLKVRYTLSVKLSDFTV